MRKSILTYLTLCVLLACVFTGSAAALPPLIPLAGGSGHPPLFSDDLEYQNLDKAIEQSLIYLRKRPSATRFTIANQSYPIDHLIHSLVFFRTLIASHPPAHLLKLEIETYFNIFQAAGSDGDNPKHNNMLVTGYYQPVLDGSLNRHAPYLYPIYSIPENLALRRDPEVKTYKIGRLEGGKFYRYWTRAEIESCGYAKGNELVYLKTPFDAFLLHVQGSGLIRLRDGSVKGIHYALKNGRQYRSIGKYMVETGKMKLSEASMETIRKYITANPGEQQEILQHNESYIFFEWTTTNGAIGSLGRELTAGRSIAVDQESFPAGALAFLSTRKPVLKEGRTTWTSLTRFVLAQDKGSAIKGPGRVDLFWGNGEDAEVTAGSMKEDGTLFFIILK